MASSCKTKQSPSSNRCGCKPVDYNHNNDTITGHGSTATNSAVGDEHASEEHFSYIKRVGSYLVGRTLGEGSFAKVRLGLHLPTAEKVAIKVLDKHRAANDNYMEMTIRREGRLLRRIRPHPNIVQLYEVMETANSLYLVLELCEGGDFLDLVASRGRLSEPECQMFLRQIIDAVSHLHSFGILHRDLKIENFMLDSTMQQIKIIDLGLSTAAPGGSTSRTQCGSPAYAAPELIRSPHYGPEVDVWSIGVDMFAMLTGGLPFTVEPFSIKNLYAKMVSRDMNPLPSDTTPEAIDLLHRLLEPEPRIRITLQAALAHPWLRTSRRVRYNAENPKTVFPQPNSIKVINGVKIKGEGQVDPSVLDLTVATRASALAGSSLGSLLRDVAAAVPSNLAATYHLLARHMKRVTEANDGDRQKQAASPLCSDSADAIAARQNQTNNQNNNAHFIVKGHIPHVSRRYDNSNDMEISYIAGSPKPVGGIISNMTRVTVAPHNLHRPAKVLPVQPTNNQLPLTLTAAATAAVSGEHGRATNNNSPFVSNNGSATPECRPHTQHVSASESEPGGGVHTLERRRLRHPRLAVPLNHCHEEEEQPIKDKKSAPDVALSNGQNQNQIQNNPNTNNHSSNHNHHNHNDGDTIKNGDINKEENVQTARYFGTSAPVSDTEGIRWPPEGVMPQCLLTSCCGELPLRGVVAQAPFFNGGCLPIKEGSTQQQQQQQRVPTSTPTPPSCMQISHIVSKTSAINEFYQSPQLTAKQQHKSFAAKSQINGEYVDSSSSTKGDHSTMRKQSAIAMFGCVGRGDQRRITSNVGDFVFSSKKQSYTPDGYSSSDAEYQHHCHGGNRMASSKTPPPPITVLTPVTSMGSGHNTYLVHHNQNSNHHQMTAAALIVKPAVQAVAAAARRVLCGASPQPIQHSTLDRSLARNAATKQAAV